MNRTTLNEKIRQSIRAYPLAACVAYGPENVQYLTGISLPFLQSSYAHQPVVMVCTPEDLICVAPASLVSSLIAQGWSGPVRPYPAGEDAAGQVAELVAKTLAPLPAHLPVAVDYERITTHQLTALKQAVPGRTIHAGDDLLRSLRRVKTSEEIELLERLAALTDHGVAGAMHHVAVLGGRTEKFMSEDLRVHCLERGTELYGYHALSQTASGLHATRFWPVSPRFGFGQEKKLQPGEIVRLEMRAVLEGYWSDAARMLTMGPPTGEQAEGYDHLWTLTQAALGAIRPGAPACAVYAAVAKQAETLNSAWIHELAAGHGVGVTPYEAPFLSAWDQTPLQSGMVLVVDLAVRLPGGEIIRNKETVTVTDSGCRVADTYEDWRVPYLAAFTF